MNIQPIFIIGSYRSATSLMGWVLGQHTEIFPLDETHFIYKLSSDSAAQHDLGVHGLARSFMSSANISRREYCIAAGMACNDLILKSRGRIVDAARLSKNSSQHSDQIKLSNSPNKKRWVDTTPENSHHVYSLLRMFPGAKFIHVLRNPKLVASSLMSFSGVGGNDYEEEASYNHWIRLVGACQLAEEAFGARVVKRIYYDDIVSDPASVVKECLEFLGLAYQADCLTPFSVRVNSSKHMPPLDISVEENIQHSKPYIRKAFALYQQLLQSKYFAPKGNLKALRLLKKMDANYIFLRNNGIEACHEGSAFLRAENLRLSIENSALQTKLMRLTLEIIDWGPRVVYAGQAFNPQVNGASALWIKVRGIEGSISLEINGSVLPVVMSEDAGLITCEIPPSLTCVSGVVRLLLKNKATDHVVGDLALSILPFE